MKKDFRKRQKLEKTPRQQPNETILFGTHAVHEAWLNPERIIHGLYITENAWANFEPFFNECRETQDKDVIRRPKPQIVEKRIVDKVAGGGVHQGIAIQCDPLPEIFVQDLISKDFKAEHSVILVLDQITDPHNVGAILRSASAFGATGVIMQRKHAPNLTGVLAKTASGAAEHIPVAYEINLSRAIEALQDKGYKALALDERGEDTINTPIDAKKVVIVLGAEGKGLRQKIKEQCDFLVRLPTSGAIQSLNVSNAAAIALYAVSVNK